LLDHPEVPEQAEKILLEFADEIKECEDYEAL
jgi:hypothetical protein